MKRWIRFVALFYPRGWREEFGDEFDAVLDDIRPGWRVFANVLRGAVEMQISEGGNWIKIAGAMAALGALVALGLSFVVAQNYSSSATVALVPQPDPVRPASAEVLQARAMTHANQMKEEKLSRAELSLIANDPRLLLYTEDMKRMPLDDVLAHMRRDIQIQVKDTQNADGAIVLSVSFLYPDQAKAQATVEELTRKFVEQDQNMSKEDTAAYLGFWGDMVQAKLSAPAPPPPTSEVARVLSPADQPLHSPPNRFVFLAWGLGAGLLVAIVIRWPRGVLRLVPFAAAGFLLAAAPSYLLHNRFTSTAEMQITPAQITEDPLATPPPATPAIEFLKQIEPQLLNDAELAYIIEDPRLNLYSEERKRKPMEEIIQTMRNNLRINPVETAPHSSSAFRISFTYSDRFKAQQTVEAVMARIQDLGNIQRRSDASRNFKAHTIWERKAGEIVDVLDVPNLPYSPDGPPRLLIALSGLGAGLLLGLFRLRRRRPDPPPQLNSNEIVLSNGV